MFALFSKDKSCPCGANMFDVAGYVLSLSGCKTELVCTKCGGSKVEYT